MILSPIKQYISLSNQKVPVFRNFVSLQDLGQATQLNFEIDLNHEEKNLKDLENLSIFHKIDLVYQITQELKFERALNLLEEIERGEMDTSQSLLASIIKYDLGILYDFLGKYKIALQKLHEALKLVDDENSDQKLYNQILEAIAITQDNNGNHSDALILFQKILGKKNMIYGENSLEVIYTINNQAIAYYNLGKFEESEKNLQTALEYFESKSMKNTIEYSIFILNLSSVFHDQGNYKKALEFANEAHSSFSKDFKSHPLVAYAINNQGFVYKTSGMTGIAESHIRRANHMLGSYFKEDHPDIAKINNNFGIVYLKRRSYDIAMTYFHTALESRKNLFGENHLDVGRTANNIGLIYFYKDEFDLSLYYYRMCLDIYMKTFGEEHPNVSIIYNNIGYSLASQNKYKEAIEHYLKAIKFRDRTLGKNDTYLAMTFMNLGSLLEFQEAMWPGLDGQKKAFTINYKNFKWSNNDVETSFRKITNIEKKYDELKYLDSNFEI